MAKKKQQTQSKYAFNKNIARAQAFITIHQEAQVGRGQPTKARQELPRAAVVFAVGAIDAYLSEVSAEVLVEQLAAEPANAINRDVLTRVQKDLPTLPLEVALLSTEADRADRIKESVADYFHNRISNHGSKAVATTLSRIGEDINDVWTYLESQGHKKPAQSLDDWTTKRHDIVHKGKQPQVNRLPANEFIDFCVALVGRVDKLALGQKP